jgi:hypothetical protein
MFKETPQGLLLFVKVIPNAGKTEIVKAENDVLKIRLKAQPEKGKANEELIRFLSKITHVPKSQISITHGLTSRNKIVCLKNISYQHLTKVFNPSQLPK